MRTIADEIRQIMVDDFGVKLEEIADDCDIFSSFGFDSLDGVQLILHLETTFDIELEDEVLDRKVMTVAELISIIEPLIAAKAG
jgi:acyl carrier protein